MPYWLAIALSEYWLELQSFECNIVMQFRHGATGVSYNVHTAMFMFELVTEWVIVWVTA